MTRLCVALPHRSLRAIRDDRACEPLRAAPAAMFELRLDLYDDVEPARLTRLLAYLGAPRCLVVCRSAAAGGASVLPVAARRALLCHALRHGAGWVDWDVGEADRASVVALRAACGPGQQIVLSAHRFAAPPTRMALRALYTAAAAAGADVVKLVVDGRSWRDGLPMAQHLASLPTDGPPCVGIVMGEAGAWSRLLAGRFAAPWSFVALRAGGGTAAGQLSWAAMHGLYRAHTVRPDTPVYALLGEPIGHSLSPVLHNTALAAAALPGIYVPQPLAGELAPFLRDMAPLLGLQGVSVTAPLKRAARAAAARVSPACAAIGAANTLVRGADGRWEGHNTDAEAAIASLRAAVGPQLAGCGVAVLGSGGAARAVAHGLREAGATVWVCSRDPARGAAFAHELGVRSAAADTLARLRPQVAVVVNATPVGLVPSSAALPLAVAQLPPGALVFDSLYRPAPTAWMAAASAAGHPVLGGLPMFVAQGLAQFALFTRRPAPPGPVMDALAAALAVLPPQAR